MITIKYTLYREPNNNLDAKQQILLNRGINLDIQEKWLNAGRADFISWRLLGEKKMRGLAEELVSAITNGENVLIIVDADNDGFASAAVLANYLYHQYPNWIEDEHLKFVMHKDKQHGFDDVLDRILEIHEETPLSIVIAPDGGSNDVESHKILHEKGIYCATLDHHIVEDKEFHNSYCNVINVEICEYPNKALTGAGVTWKFCECLDEYIKETPEALGIGQFAENFIDIAALGDIADMADLREIEIKALTNVGLSQITNPFFKAMAEKNSYSINNMNGINYYSVAFYVCPYVNGTIRSGTMEEKELVFKSMLEYEANKMVPSSKRGHKGEMVPLWEEAVLVAERVKRRQTKYQNETMELFEDKIIADNLDDHAIIVIKCEQGEVEPGLAGLIANKIMAKYQHPCMVLTHGVDDNGEVVYSGSARNIPNSPIEDLREFVEHSEYSLYSSGHASAFGCSFPDTKIDTFIEDTDALCRREGYKFEPVYKVDYIWGPSTIDSQKILDIAQLDIYGQNIPESYVAVENLPLSQDNVTLMGLQKGHPTIKITVGDVAIIKFKASEEMYNNLISGNKVINLVGKCKMNEWQGKITPQIIVEDWDIREEWIF